MTQLSSIFATGMVAAQHANFVLCMGFLEGLSGVGGNEKRPRIRQRLLSQPSVSEFKARWNLPIYFQLRQVVCSGLVAVAFAGVGVGVERCARAVRGAHSPSDSAQACVVLGAF